MSSKGVFQVIEELTDGRGAPAFLEMNDYEVFSCADWVRTHYEKPWTAPPLEDGELRVHPGTMRFRSLNRLPSSAIAISDQKISELTFGVEPQETILRILRRAACGGLLYADTVVEVDPLSMADRNFRLWPEQAEGLRWHFHDSARLIGQVRPLIEAGILILTPDPGPDNWITQDFAAASALLRREEEKFWEADGDTTDVASTLYDLRVAAQADAVILGIDMRSWQAIDLATGSSSRTNADLTVATGLGFAELPFLAGIPMTTVVRIHDEEAAFVEWRAGLRNAARLLRYAPSEDVFRQEAKEVFEDSLAPQAAAVERAVSRSAALRAAVLDEPIRTAFGAAAMGATTAALGLPLSEVLVGALGGAIGNVAASVLRPKAPTGSARVFYELQR